MAAASFVGLDGVNQVAGDELGALQPVRRGDHPAVGLDARVHPAVHPVEVGPLMVGERLAAVVLDLRDAVQQNGHDVAHQRFP
ncbi:MAG: hypothetical protein MUF57_09945 [Gammaproteobacteria bacterium]|nr:hypothetical protein [Gammaproteobacteria bacterium]